MKAKSSIDEGCMLNYLEGSLIQPVPKTTISCLRPMTLPATVLSQIYSVRHELLPQDPISKQEAAGYPHNSLATAPPVSMSCQAGHYGSVRSHGLLGTLMTLFFLPAIYIASSGPKLYYTESFLN